MALMLMIWVAEALAAEALLFAALAFAVISELPRRYRAAALKASVSQSLQETIMMSATAHQWPVLTAARSYWKESSRAPS
jgi:hypothetical protein